MKITTTEEYNQAMNELDNLIIGKAFDQLSVVETDRLLILTDAIYEYEETLPDVIKMNKILGLE